MLIEVDTPEKAASGFDRPVARPLAAVKKLLADSAARRRAELAAASRGSTDASKGSEDASKESVVSAPMVVDEPAAAIPDETSKEDGPITRREQLQLQPKPKAKVKGKSKAKANAKSLSSFGQGRCACGSWWRG